MCGLKDHDCRARMEARQGREGAIRQQNNQITEHQQDIGILQIYIRTEHRNITKTLQKGQAPQSNIQVEGRGTKQIHCGGGGPPCRWQVPKVANCYYYQAVFWVVLAHGAGCSTTIGPFKKISRIRKRKKTGFLTDERKI